MPSRTFRPGAFYVFAVPLVEWHGHRHRSYCCQHPSWLEVGFSASPAAAPVNAQPGAVTSGRSARRKPPFLVACIWISVRRPVFGPAPGVEAMVGKPEKDTERVVKARTGSQDVTLVPCRRAHPKQHHGSDLLHHGLLGSPGGIGVRRLLRRFTRAGASTPTNGDGCCAEAPWTVFPRFTARQPPESRRP